MAEKQVTLQLSMPASGYHRRMFFNRFEIETLDGRPLFRFGLVREAHGPLLDSFSCIVDRVDLESNRDRLLSYLPQLEDVPPVKLVPWVPPFEVGTVEVVSLINLAKTKGSAEILLGSYSMHAAVSAARSAGKVTLETQPIALLRCDTTVQKAFLTKLAKFL